MTAYNCENYRESCQTLAVWSPGCYWHRKDGLCGKPDPERLMCVLEEVLVDNESDENHE